AAARRAHGRRQRSHRAPGRAAAIASFDLAESTERRFLDAAHQGGLRSGGHPRAGTLGVRMTGPIPMPYPNADAPAQDLIAACVHCGFCLPTCPTFAVLGVEMDSPRGRIHLMKTVWDHRLGADSPGLEDHISKRSEEHTSELQSLAYLVC